MAWAKDRLHNKNMQCLPMFHRCHLDDVTDVLPDTAFKWDSVREAAVNPRTGNSWDNTGRRRTSGEDHLLGQIFLGPEDDPPALFHRSARTKILCAYTYTHEQTNAIVGAGRTGK